ncbi:hypothetical protein [Granulicella aggregans]|uniref:hypothetical protein n=1 Tax=Granulicella aggregans TaxID=474949 RepID=UPI0021DFF5E9|nr:hypothetical protein [Granulicella aggregans]
MSAFVVEPRDPPDRFAKPPFPQKQQTGSGSSNQLDPLQITVNSRIKGMAV